MVDRNYINSLSLDELRRELEHSLEVQYGVLYALRDAPELPNGFVLKHLGTVAKYPDDFDRGKMMQREHGLDAVPPKHECEGGAGMWERIRRGLTAAR